MTLRKTVILGITGGVAAYKAADITRRLMERRVNVQVVMTKNAEAFIAPLTFEALTGNPVIRANLPAPGEEPMPHIELARSAALMLVAPATANIIGKFNNGVADDTLSTLLLACKSPVIMAPAMNVEMYQKSQVQENIARLKERGVTFVGPDAGELACGDTGEGRLASVEEIVATVAERLRLQNDLGRYKIIVTAGGTREPIDPVRYIGNRSSGKMGLALARAAYLRGANVTLIAAAVEIDLPDEIDTIRVETADEMKLALDEQFVRCDALIMTAAVGDFHVKTRPAEKVRRKEEWSLLLQANPDILGALAARKEARIVIGFAAEVGPDLIVARQKLLRKNLDMIVVNDVSRSDIGFGADQNEVTIIGSDGREKKIERTSKNVIADNILDAAFGTEA